MSGPGPAPAPAPAPAAAPTDVFLFGGQALAPFCHNPLQRAVLALPGQNVLVVQGQVTMRQVRSQRPSYINSFLIQSRGAPVANPCNGCRRAQSMSIDGLARPFPACVRLPGHFGGCCGNCKWRDHASRCSVLDRPNNGDGGDNDDDDDDDDNNNNLPPPRVKKEPRTPSRRSGRTAGGSAANPIVIS
ncbi:hypothetical protein F5X97DRAFT_342744 [Nemania serpens]|nr:hypothetical protein F5X97DRAFT_342744 [Nemania serpens]